MKSKILGLLAVGLLAGPTIAHAIPLTGTYHLSLTGGTTGTGTFDYDATTGNVSNFFVSIGLIAGSLDTDPLTGERGTCFVEWGLSPAGTSCVNPSRISVGDTDPGAPVANYEFTHLNTFMIFQPFGQNASSYSGGYSVSLKDPPVVPEPGTLALLALGLAGLGFARRRKLN